MFSQEIAGMLRALLTAVSLSLVMPTAGSARAQLISDLTKPTETLLSVIQDWEVSRNTNLDPRAAELLQSEITHFRGVAGVNYDTDPPTRNADVDRLAGNRQALSAVVFAYLDAARTKELTPTLLNLLLMRIGSSASAAGWPDLQYSSFELVDFTSQLPRGEYTLTADGLVDSGASPARKFLVLPGDHMIKPANGEAEGWGFETVARPAADPRFAAPKRFDPAPRTKPRP